MSEDMIESLTEWDWEEAFGCAMRDSIMRCEGVGEDVSIEPFARKDVAEVIAIDDGENDERSWIVVGRLNDGRFFFLEAWCDYTGWG